jgi:uncharacterized membrane protein
MLPTSSSAGMDLPPQGSGTPPTVSRALYRTVASNLWLLIPVIVGTVLRLWNLRAQVLSDDEVLSVRLALSDRLQEILTTYHLADNCIPLTAYLHVLVLANVRLTETLVRLPGVLSGIALLVLLPWAVSRAFDRLTAQHLAWLLAISPSLIFYSRIARSYMPALFLGVAAAVCFYVWWSENPTRRIATGYVTLAALAAWFHLVALPFVLTPFAYAALSLRESVSRRRQAWGLVGLGLGLGAAFSLFMLPALSSLRDVLTSKHHRPAGLSIREVVCVTELVAGNGHPAVATLFWLTAIAGLVLLLVRVRRLATYTLGLFLAPLAAILVMAPSGYQYPVVLHRYLLFCLPSLLLWIAVALAAAGRGLARLTRAATPLSAAGFLALAVLVASGPLTNLQIWRSPFMHQEPWIVYCSLCRPAPAKRVSTFYTDLAHTRGAAPVLEYPWIPLWEFTRALNAYQEIHGQDVVVASPRDSLWSDSLNFRNMVSPDPDDLLGSRARYLVVHRNLSAEELSLSDTPFAESDPELFARVMPEFKGAARALARDLKRLWGPPDFRDETVQVWDLRRVRLAQKSEGGGNSH